MDSFPFDVKSGFLHTLNQSLPLQFKIRRGVMQKEATDSGPESNKIDGLTP